MKQHGNPSALLQSNPAPSASACLPSPVHSLTNSSSGCASNYDPACFPQPSYSSDSPAYLKPAAYNPYRRFSTPVSSSFDSGMSNYDNCLESSDYYAPSTSSVLRNTFSLMNGCSECALKDGQIDSLNSALEMVNKDNHQLLSKIRELEGKISGMLKAN